MKRHADHFSGLFRELVKTGKAQPEEDYNGVGARLYDRMQPGGRDLKGWLKLADRHGSPILELGAGTGRVALSLARAGFAVTALELSADMIDVFATKKARETKAVQDRITVCHGDMRRFSLDSRFSLVLLPLRTLVHLTEPQDRMDTFRCAFRHLQAGGSLILDVELPGGDDECAEPHWRDVDLDPETGLLLLTVVQKQPLSGGKRLTNLLYVTVDAANQAALHVAASVECPIPAEQLRWELEQCGYDVSVARNFEGAPLRSGDNHAIVTAAKPVG